VSAEVSFHLVDRIVEIDLERSVRGTFAIPPDFGRFPACLVVEAIGQLASWVAMRRTDFTRRPVAARAGEVRVLGTVAPGAELALDARIRSCKGVAISYDGVARAGGRTIVELEGAVGALVPMAEFEAPEEASARFAALCGDGLPGRRFPDPAALAPRVVEREATSARTLRAVLEAPPPGAIYADHFPRRPVYPATLLLDAQLALALRLLDGDASTDTRVWDERFVGMRARDIKVRSFTPPGGRVTISAEIGRDGSSDGVPLSAEWDEVAIAATSGDKRVSSAALLVPRTPAAPSAAS